MLTGKANGDERKAALSGRVMERADDSAGSDRNRCTTDDDSHDAPGRGGMARRQTRGLPRFEAACNCRVRAIDVPLETLVHRLQAMH